nr:cationic amino acid transporter 2, vacuolar-like isoform X1 [Ipomoea trifida]
MGFVSDWQKSGGCERGYFAGGLRSLVRRKQVDSAAAHSNPSSSSSPPSSSGHGRVHHHQLAKALAVPHLIAIGVGSTVGAGVYILVGTVAREHTGPALTISFLIAGIAAALSAFCYAELASRCPSAGSAYHYSYICVGEGVAWLIGWALILEYTIGGSAVARGISPNLSTMAQGFITMANICAMVFVIVVGGYLGFKTGWPGYDLPVGYFPFGVNGMLTGASTVFFSYIGFDTVASTSEEVKNPQRDLPLGIGLALLICCMLYMLVSAVIVGLVPYYAMDPDTPISTAFGSYGIEWAVYIITTGACTALCSTLLGSLLPQPRILMAMARDGLLPSFFSDVNKHTQVPVKSTLVTGLLSGALAFFMNVDQLAGMVSVGTLLAFTVVAISVLILRYVPPDEVPLPPSFQEAIDAVTIRYSRSEDNADITKTATVTMDSDLPLLVKAPVWHPLPEKAAAQFSCLVSERRKVAGWAIVLTCIGVLVLASAASSVGLPNSPRFILSGIGGFLVLSGLLVLTSIHQDDARHNFGHSGGFVCPFVPLLPIACILINVYLLINLGGATWARVSVWLLIGMIVYILYGRSHSKLQDAVYVPAAHVDEIYRNSDFSLP